MGLESTPSSQMINRQGYNLVAVGFMSIAVVGFSLVPMVVHFAGGDQSPFLFNFWLRIGISIGCIVFLLALFPRDLLDVANLLLILRSVRSWLIVLAAVGGTLEYAFFAWSVQFIDIAVATILFRIWPICLVFLLAWLYRESGRYRKITIMTVLLFCLGLAGFVLAMLSQFGEASAFDSLLAQDSSLGFAFVMVAVAAAALSACSVKWGSDLTRLWLPRNDHRLLEWCGVVIALLLTSLVSAVSSAIIGFGASENLSLNSSFVAVVGGVMTYAASSIAWRGANLTSSNVGINAMIYAAPVLSLLWLFFFADAVVARLDYLVVGAAAIVTANLLINFEAEIRWGFRTLLLALGIFGSVVYLRDGVFRFLGDGPFGICCSLNDGVVIGLVNL